MTPPFGLSNSSPGASSSIRLESPKGDETAVRGEGSFIAPVGTKLLLQAPESDD